MFTRVKNLWNRLTSSLWFIPGLMALGSLVLAAVVQTLDARYDPDPEEVPLLYRGTAEGAGSALSSVAGSMIGVTGVVFSITVVALSLASSQLGPRLLRNFMRDTANQVVFGTFLGTFLFCLVGLQAVNRDLGLSGVPRITVTVAFVLALLSLAVLIYFIHHITLSMQADTVISNVGEELRGAVDRLFPGEMGDPAPEDMTPVEPGGEPRAIMSPRSGYIQAIDEERLLGLAMKLDVVVFLAARPGDYMRLEGPLARVHPAHKVDEDAARGLAKAFILGPRRTAEQDIEFLVAQLVETACRALSPGTNDPFTAIACIDRLGDTMAILARKEFPRAGREGPDGKLRVVARPPTFEGLMDTAFDQVRQYGKGSVSVTKRLLEVLEHIDERIPEGDPRREHVREHARRVRRTSLAADLEESDQAAIEARFARVMERGAREPERFPSRGPPPHPAP